MRKIKTQEVTGFAKYVKEAMKTCTQEQCKTPMYMSLGLVGEVGELANKVKKIIRDGGHPADQATDEEKKPLCAELGDIMWYCAGLLHITAGHDNLFVKDKFDDIEKTSVQATGFKDATTEELMQFLASSAGKVSEWIMTGRKAPVFDLRMMVMCVANIAQKQGSTLQDICQENISKLADRYKRNKIGGSGDDR